MEHIEMSDESLIAEVKRLLDDECRSMALLLARLAEVDARKLYARLGFPSLFSFMTRELHLSEDAAYKRIQAARAAKRFPIVLSMIAGGEVNLTSINILCPILTEENHCELLQRAVHRSKREVEMLRAECSPMPDVPDMIRRLPQGAALRQTQGAACAGASSCLISDAAHSAEEHQIPSEAKPESGSFSAWNLDASTPTPARREMTTPIAANRVKFQFTGSEELRKKLDRAREILLHKHPAGRIEDIVDEALEAFLKTHDPDRKLARCAVSLPSRRERNCAQRTPEKRDDAKPVRKSRTRRIPQCVKDVVWKRDEGRCQYVSPDGRRCDQRGKLEFHHVHAWGKGGSSDDPRNLTLMCRTHNLYLAREEFGEKMSRWNSFARDKGQVAASGASLPGPLFSMNKS